MNDIDVLLIIGIGLVALDYFVDKYIFGNDKHATLYKIGLFIILILLVGFSVEKDILAVLIALLFLMIINKLKIIVKSL
ncbi:hypothetical protein HMPREF9990_08410 [Staphylococcus epidermidis NIHLM061]|uniref:hypothetical protein n=1 Tax=Staphylococcus epidermidis TaxID=1282 RepID=UPI00026C1CEC|nr:hypothetical protein [Staphylococcus epidermidis]EJD87824.1 hypothetical protein HMPREF9990_08410 [Staphylococcus epidermidis NIHLM061]